jgi:DNA repair exonuclease SbcCD ATPase subunit
MPMDKIQEILRELTDRISAVETSAQGLWKSRSEDITGWMEQLRGSLQTVSELEVELKELQDKVKSISFQREAAWNSHEERCKNCLKGLEVYVKAAIDEWHEKPDKMPFIAFLKHYWIRIIIGAILATSFLQLNETIIKIAYNLIFNQGGPKVPLH